MEWGIINKENFSSINEVPLKRWDQLSTIKIKTESFGLRKEKERFYGHYSYLSPIRGKRPKGFKDSSSKKSEFKDCEKIQISEYKDVFSKIIDNHNYENLDNTAGEGYTIIITEDEIRRDDPFSLKPHRIQKISEDAKAVTLINRYPSMARVIDSEVKGKIEKNIPPRSKLSTGINLVTISRKFLPSLCFDMIPEDILTAIFLSMKAAIIYCVQSAIEKDYYDIPISPFFNIGTKVGGSQPRLHSQVYIDLNEDGHGSRLEGYLKAFKEMKDDCHLCRTNHGENEDSNRVILNTEFWIFYATGSPVRNYHLRFHPKEHIRRFSQLNKNQLADLAKSLKILFTALDQLKVDRNRNILFNGCPYGYDADMHFFGDIIPHEIIGGAEMAEDMRVARKLPESTAKEIRDMIREI
jgi:UDPglucose--hexose-1-phosphate uridylyltransferase